VLAALPAHVRATLLAPHFFPTLIAGAFMDSLRVVFLFAAGISVVAAVASVLRGRQYIYDDAKEADGPHPEAHGAAASAAGVIHPRINVADAPAQVGQTEPSESDA
jgi:hypothetical protein